MEKLGEQLSERHGINIHILATTKYHCEFAGDGVEYGWGYGKKVFRRIPLAQKKGKTAFWDCVKSSLRSVTVNHMRKFSAKARRYMLTYKVFDNAGSYADFETEGLSYAEIEKHVTKLTKTHRSSGDQEKGYIAQVWRESQQQSC